MSSLCSYTLLLQIWLIYNEINQCFGAAATAGGTFSLGFNVDFSSDSVITQAVSISSGMETNIEAFGGVDLGDVAVASELEVMGATLLAEQMSILGASNNDAKFSADASAIIDVESGLEDIGAVELLFLFTD